MQAVGEFCEAFPSIRGTSAWSCDDYTPSMESTLSSASTWPPIPTSPTRASSEWVCLLLYFSDNYGLTTLGSSAGEQVNEKKSGAKVVERGVASGIKCCQTWRSTGKKIYYRENSYRWMRRAKEKSDVWKFWPPVSWCSSIWWSWIPIWIFTSSKSDEKRLKRFLKTQEGGTAKNIYIQKVKLRMKYRSGAVYRKRLLASPSPSSNSIGKKRRRPRTVEWQS